MVCFAFENCFEYELLEFELLYCLKEGGDSWTVHWKMHYVYIQSWLCYVLMFLRVVFLCGEFTFLSFSPPVSSVKLD